MPFNNDNGTFDKRQHSFLPRCHTEDERSEDVGILAREWMNRNRINMNNITKIIASELNIGVGQVERTIALIDEGNTIPFIARYRKEVTGSLSDDVLRELNDKLTNLRALEKRRAEVHRLISEQGKMTPAIEKALNKADKLNAIEDIYLPFKPKRHTRAMIAKEQGLEPLAQAIYKNNNESEIEQLAQNYLNDKITTTELALNGALDIIAEDFSDDASIRAVLRKFVQEHALIISAKGKEEDDNLYEIYHDYSELAKNIPAHRILAINRGEKENKLKVKVDIDKERCLELVKDKALTLETYNKYIETALKDAIKRLILPALERELRSELSAKAEEQAINVFALNLKQLLLGAPLKDKVVIGFDPAYRTGCKLAVLDKKGKLLDYATIYPTKPHNDTIKSSKVMLDFIAKYNVDLIAIGNGTASRESEAFVADVIKKTDREVHYIIVSEAGASVYSASALAAAEYPEIDVSIRGAISIAARTQDPLSELVKIEAKAIGVGQYQHDVNQKRLDEVLTGITEDAVNSVGVNLSTASEALLSYIAGISAKTAKEIVSYRHSVSFTSRKDLLKVKGIGKAAFQQAAGFLRIANPKEALDNTAVHPESYKLCYQLMELLNIEAEHIGHLNPSAKAKATLFGIDKLAEKLGTSELQINDLLNELDKPARDPRDEIAAPILRSDVLKIEDLEIGMLLKGTVRNVVDFGAFVDIGLKQAGLVHISELSNKFVKKAMDIVAVGDIVSVKVLAVDSARGKVSLSMKAAQ